MVKLTKFAYFGIVSRVALFIVFGAKARFTDCFESANIHIQHQPSANVTLLGAEDQPASKSQRSTGVFGITTDGLCDCLTQCGPINTKCQIAPSCVTASSKLCFRGVCYATCQATEVENHPQRSATRSTPTILATE
jgi:hypothetical protein